MSAAIFINNMMSTYQLSYQSKVMQIVFNTLAVVPLAPAVMIATCKDLGRKKTFAIVGVVYTLYIIGFLFALIRPLHNITTIDITVYFYIA